MAMERDQSSGHMAREGGDWSMGHHQASASRSEVSATSTQTSATGQAPPSLHDSGPNAPYALAADTAQKPALIFDNLPLPALIAAATLPPPAR